MKKLLKKISQGLIITGFILSQKTAQAQMIYGNSILCSNRNWTTVVALSTNEFNAVICNNNNENYYIGQNRNTNESIVLPLSEIYNAGRGMIYKAVNGNYTYQIYVDCTSGNSSRSWATLSVFNNGRRIRSERVNRLMSGQMWCMDAFGQDG